jgi:hypothetical protein
MYRSDLVTMKQIHAATGVPSSTLWQMVSSGYLIPAIPSSGRGQEALFASTAIQQVRNAVQVRRLMGDGEAAREILRGLAVDPTDRVFELTDKEEGVSLRLSFA